MSHEHAIDEMARLVAKYKARLPCCRSSIRAEVRVDSSGCAQIVPLSCLTRCLPRYLSCHVDGLSVDCLVAECEATGLILELLVNPRGAHTGLPHSAYWERGLEHRSWRGIYPQLASPSRGPGLMVGGASATIFSVLMATAGLSAL